MFSQLSWDNYRGKKNKISCWQMNTLKLVCCLSNALRIKEEKEVDHLKAQKKL